MDGILNLLKPPGMTSSDAVVDVRRLFGQKKVGHTGTLDPGAAGVLPICLGKATRLFDYLMEKQKEYIAEVSFGCATDTLDSYGQVTGRKTVCVSAGQVQAVLPELTGLQQQVPPMYSAVRHNGQKLYQLARKGKSPEEAQIEKKARTIEIHALELIEQTGENRFLIRMACSKGTYVRVVCEEIGKRLDVPAHMSFLLRSRSGMFSLENAVTLTEAKETVERGEGESLLIPMDRALEFLPRISVDERCAARLENGNAIHKWAVRGPLCPAGRVYCGGRFFGIGTVTEEELVMKTMLLASKQE